MHVTSRYVRQLPGRINHHAEAGGHFLGTQASNHDGVNIYE
jgi:hypothetical protein